MKLANQQTSTSAKARPSDPNVLGFEESSEDDESDDESSEGAESVSDSEEAEGSSENHQSKVEGSIGDNINSKDKSKDVEQNEPEDPDDKKGTPCDQETMSCNKKKVTSDEASVVKVKINTYKSIFLFSRPKQPLLSLKYIRFFSIRMRLASSQKPPSCLFLSTGLQISLLQGNNSSRNHDSMRLSLTRA